MNIIETDAFDKGLVVEDDYHILTFAETGFAMLSIYGELFGLDFDTINKFSNKVNKNDELGSLHPQASISAVPRRFIRDEEDRNALSEQIEYFLKANQETIKATKLLFDFSAGGVASFVIDACRQALKSPYTNNIDEVIIINSKSF
jgi:hypothetical protein